MPALRGREGAPEIRLRQAGAGDRERARVLLEAVYACREEGGDDEEEGGVKERPIIFSGEMVRAILEGRKTQTRRVMKPQPNPGIGKITQSPGDDALWDAWWSGDGALARSPVRCPFGVPGDRLWVRETSAVGKHRTVAYKADMQCGAWGRDGDGGLLFVRHGYLVPKGNWGLEKYGNRWRPSMHTPRWASRLTLEITNIRVERLQDISEEDAKAEGVIPYKNIGSGQIVPGPGFNNALLEDQPHRLPFSDLWDSLHGPDAWDKNPWVWVIEFRRTS